MQGVRRLVQQCRGDIMEAWKEDGFKRFQQVNLGSGNGLDRGIKEGAKNEISKFCAHMMWCRKMGKALRGSDWGKNVFLFLRSKHFCIQMEMSVILRGP